MNVSATVSRCARIGNPAIDMLAPTVRVKQGWRRSLATTFNAWLVAIGVTQPIGTDWSLHSHFHIGGPTWSANHSVLKVCLDCPWSVRNSHSHTPGYNVVQLQKLLINAGTKTDTSLQRNEFRWFIWGQQQDKLKLTQLLIVACEHKQ